MENHRRILVCQGTGCISGRSDQVYEALKTEVQQSGLKDVSVDFTGCHGFCEQGPNVVIEPEGIFYTHVQQEDAAEIVSSHLGDGQPVERLFYRDPVSGQAMPLYSDIKFYAKQQRVVLRNCGHINPERIEDYIASGGYRALKKALLEMTPEEVVGEITKSGLRGRGGAGFPTGRKWEFCRNGPTEEKYVICNADEGDPGAFMDRSILEADPHAVIEGLAIAGYAIGANEGYIYVRAEYPLAVHRFRVALQQAQERGYLGKDILGSGFNFTIHVKEGAGAFVCGEETALIASIESRRGMPRPRPPFPAQSGLGGNSTNINNVKTLAAVPAIVDRGAEWFASLGTEKSRGTAVFALSGKIANSGLVEVPMGTPLSTIIYDIGGGIPRGKQLKAVQTGGPSGGCIPAHLVDLPVDYESLAEIGSIMGSGGMVVLDNTNCMVDMARFFLSFTTAESCGKCSVGRIGTRLMHETLKRITNGEGTADDIELLKETSDVMQTACLCALGRTASNPVLTTLRYFEKEYADHIEGKKCEALVCKPLVTYCIDSENCKGCLVCVKSCHVQAISGEKGSTPTIDRTKCAKCGTCADACPFDAITKVPGMICEKSVKLEECCK